MFGRRKTPFGAQGSPSSITPPTPPSGAEPFPIDKMDGALDAAIRMFTRVCDDAGVDIGDLALRGRPVPAGVGTLLADCTTYRSDNQGGETYLALGVTHDFKSFAYPPHCRLYFVLNSVGICEEPAAQSILADLAPGQLPGPLVDAHLLHSWIHFILPTSEAMNEGSAAQDAFIKALSAGLSDVVRRVPTEWVDRLGLKERFTEFAGFPGAIGQPLNDTVERMNGLPVTPFIAEVLTRELARLQMEGLRQRR